MFIKTFRCGLLVAPPSQCERPIRSRSHPPIHPSPARITFVTSTIMFPFASMFDLTEWMFIIIITMSPVYHKSSQSFDVLDFIESFTQTSKIARVSHG